MKLLYVANQARFFISHRLALAEAARAAGYEVHIATPPATEVATLQDAGFPHHPIPLNRRGASPWEEAATLHQLYRLYRALRPALVHHVTIKPVIYGSSMARLARVPAVVNAITGLGYTFLKSGTKARVLRLAVKTAYRLALSHPRTRVIFQNPDDRAFFVQNHLIDPDRAVIIKGAGVDMARFAPTPEPEGNPPVVLLPSRMLWDKGVAEFVAAAEQLRAEGVQARFVLLGDTDPDNRAAVPRAQLEAWDTAGAVEWWGYRDGADMPALVAQSALVCLPSYREGVPKALIEAAASGRAIITTNAPGCRELVPGGENGLLVPVRDAVALAGALRALLDDPARRQAMGARGRAIAEAGFSLRQVIDETLAVYAGLLPDVETSG